MTKRYRIKYWITTILSYLLMFGPLFYYLISAFCEGAPQQKITLGFTITAAILLTGLSLIFKKHIRSTIFILIMGIYTCLENILPLIVLISVCTIIDEFIVTPLRTMYHQKLIINKEIDKRG